MSVSASASLLQSPHLRDVKRALLLAVEAFEQLAPAVKHEEHALPTAGLACLQLPDNRQKDWISG